MGCLNASAGTSSPPAQTIVQNAEIFISCSRNPRSCRIWNRSPKLTARSYTERVKKEEVAAIALARHQLHQHQASHRPLSDNYELVGIAGEMCAELDFRIPRDTRLLIAGDGRKDGILKTGETVDFKVARLAYNLLMEVNQAHADILVLGRYEEHGNQCWVVWLGWEYSFEMLLEPTKRFVAGGPVNHYKHASRLRPIEGIKDKQGLL